MTPKERAAKAIANCSLNSYDVELADAALAAIAEPSEVMVRVACRMIDDESPWPFAVNIWRAMHAAMMEEKS